MSMIDTNALINLHLRQLKQWRLAAQNYDALKNVHTKTFCIGGLPWIVQFNPARIASTAANVDSTAIAKRPCFLCDANRPVEQLELSVDSGYKILVNPFPIFPLHFTIPANVHTKQLIIANGAERFVHMLQLARLLPGMALFYNGALCGASAPDHFHFQAVESVQLPMLDWVDINRITPFRIESGEFESITMAQAWFVQLCKKLKELPENHQLDEPRINILCTLKSNGKLQVVVIPRKAHRPDFYGVGQGKLLLSPASVDLAGVVISPSPGDFNTGITTQMLLKMFSQTCYQ